MRMPLAIAAALVACAVAAAEGTPPGPLRLAGTHVLIEDSLPYSGPTPATHRLLLALVAFRDTAWDPARALDAVREAAVILSQCRVRLERAELQVFDGGDPAWRSLSTSVSRPLVRRLQVAKPAVFFVRDTRHPTAFEAEAFGTGNTRTRPELAGTVWLTENVRDLPVALAHELVHVLADSGAHSDLPNNLMREETAPGNRWLTAEQCEATRTSGERNGWLQRELQP